MTDVRAEADEDGIRGLTPWPPLHFVERGKLRCFLLKGKVSTSIP